MKSLLIQAALLLAMTLPAAADDALQITDPYARVLVGNGAAYFMIHNHADTDDVLLSVSSPVAAMVHLMNSSSDAGGVMTMVMVDGGFPIAAGQTRTLRGGGDHVMLMDVTEKLMTGDTMTLVLRFERAGEVTLTVPVDNQRSSEPGPGPTEFDAGVTIGDDAGPAGAASHDDHN